jgi:uncharacterized protein YdgA (DUF945 family)
MKKIAIVIGIALALLLVAAPWGIGRLAETRVDRGLDQLVAAAPYLRLAGREYARGWFRSQQQVTFEFVGSGEPVPPRFTVRNEILHGPVLWLAGFGVANVHTRVEWPADVRAMFVEKLGSAEPMRIATRIGFFGGRRTTFIVDGNELTRTSGEKLAWRDARLVVTYSSSFDSVEMHGRWSGIESSDASGVERQFLEDVSLDGESERIENDLYDGDVELRIGRIGWESPSGKTAAEDVFYVAEVDEDDGFVNVSFRFGSGELSSAVVNVPGGKIDEVHADFAVRRLDTKMLSQVVTTMKRSYEDPAAHVDAVRTQMLGLFAKDPELVVERVGFSAPDGAAYLKGIARFRGVVPEDFALGGLGLVAKAEAKLDFEADRKLLVGLPAGVATVDQMLESGFLRSAGEKLLSTLELAGGELKINGKVQGIPGLGVPPPVGGTEEVPPQE